MEDKRSCSFCLKIICDKDFDPDPEFTINMLDILLIKPKMNEYIEEVVCSVCTKSLKEAYDFKMACLNMGNKLSALNESGENVKVNLKDLYLKKEPSVEASEIVENQKSCRFCRGLIATDCCTYLNESKDNMFIVDTLQNHIPELNLSIMEELVVCESCLDSLQNFHKFIKLSLGSTKTSLGKELDDRNQIMEENLCSMIKKEDFVAIESEIDDPMKIEYVDVNVKNEETIDKIDHGCNSIVALGPQTNGSDTKQCEPNSPVITYECSWCSYKTARKKYLKNHLMRHKQPSEVTMYKCSVCPFRSKYKRDLGRHEFIHKDPSEITMLKCDICPYETKQKHLLRRHMINHNPSEIKLYKCDECPYESKHKSCLLTHQLRHKDPLEIPILKCGLCTYEARTKRALRFHMINHKSSEEITMYKCDQCSYESKRKDVLVYHKLSHKDPSEIPMYKCEICSHASKYKSAILRHLKTHKKPEDLKMYKCDVCTYQTWNKRNLREHSLMHKDPSEIKWFKCELCTYETRFGQNLKAHCRLKHGDPSKIKMYKCDECPYQTSLKSDLIKHVVIHKQPWETTMYKCEVCSLETKHKAHLNSHMRIHKKHATQLEQSETKE